MTAARGYTVGAAAAALLVGVLTCWILAQPDGPAPSAWVEALALGAAALLVGLGGLGLLGAQTSPGTVAIVSTVWGAAALIAAWLDVADRAGVAPSDVRVADLVRSVDAGLPAVVPVLGAAAVLAWTWYAASGGRFRSAADGYVVAAIGALGILVAAVTGHGGHSAWLPVVVGGHALAGSWWTGSLAALVVEVRGRGGWARTLPEFSRVAMYVVAALAVTGLVAGIGQIGFDADWWTTGYGRVMLAKAVLLGGAVVLAARHRRGWLEKARRHGVAERDSIRNAGVEVAVLAAVVGLAAGLSTTAY